MAIGCCVTMARCDVAVATEAQAALAGTAGGPAVRSVIHAGGNPALQPVHVCKLANVSL